MKKDDITTKMRIVNKAIELFKEFGFSNVTVNQICESLGITRSAFYYYFKTKDEVIDYYLLTPDLYVSEKIIPILEASNYRSQFYQILDLYLKRVVEVGPEIVGLVLKRNIDANIQNTSPRDITSWQLYVSLVEKAQKSGEVSNALDPETLVETIIYLINGIGLAWCNKQGGFDYIEECKRLVENIF